ncbi:MAG: hypothetical protein ACAH59_08520 [Pseudobdellovibrionaceae bacterium]
MAQKVLASLCLMATQFAVAGLPGETCQETILLKSVPAKIKVGESIGSAQLLIGKSVCENLPRTFGIAHLQIKVEGAPHTELSTQLDETSRIFVIQNDQLANPITCQLYPPIVDQFSVAHCRLSLGTANSFLENSPEAFINAVAQNKLRRMGFDHGIQVVGKLVSSQILVFEKE